jgi:transcriptional regulator with XRE-family HTH domain
MSPKKQIRRLSYNKLGMYLKAARNRLHDEQAGRVVRIDDMAEQLNVTPGFVYQVEQGKRKPKDGQFAKWASAYGVRTTDMWRCLGRIPMDLVASLKEQGGLTSSDPFTQLTEEEKIELRPFLNFVKWNIAHQVPENETIKKDS